MTSSHQYAKYLSKWKIVKKDLKDSTAINIKTEDYNGFIKMEQLKLRLFTSPPVVIN